jgi:GTPase SAR1 family protein
MLIALGLVPLLVAAAPQQTDQDLAKLREQGLKAIQEKLTAEGRIMAYEELQKRIKEATQAAGVANPKKVGAPKNVWDEIATALKDEGDLKRKEIEKQTTKIQAMLTSTSDAWLKVANTSDLVEKEFEKESKLKLKIAQEKSLADGLPWEWLLASAGGSVALGLILLAIDRRRSLRVWLRSRATRALVLLVASLPMLAPGCSPFNDQNEDPNPDVPKSDPNEERDKLKNKFNKWVEKTKSEAESKKAEAEALAIAVKKEAKEARKLRLKEFVPSPEAPLKFFGSDDNLLNLNDVKNKGESLLNKIVEVEAESQGRLIDALGALGAIDQLAKNGVSLASNKNKVAADSAAWNRELFERGSRAAIALVAILLAFVPLMVVRKRQRRLLRDSAQSCPRCCERGTLSDVDRGGRDKFGRPILNKYCGACQYEYPANYTQYETISFPTVGIPNSGKTLWMLSLYHQINTSQVPESSALRLLNSGFNQLIDTLVEDMLIRGLLPSANSPELPDPLVFHQCDRDKLLGPSEVLFNLFDFSGEMMFRDAYTDILRRRALQCNGFLFFLDPTNQNFAQQLNELGRFLNNLRAFRAAFLSQKIDVPVAVCITKIDLLVTHNQMDDAARPWIQELRATAGAPITMKMLRWRSNHVSRVIDQMFQGGNLRASLRAQLGNNVMFFPLTPISLDDEQLGVIDMNQRNLNPFGVLEPVYWLMHMNGYCTL